MKTFDSTISPTWIEPERAIEFFGPDKTVVGKLSWEDGYLTFTGDADASAQLFIDTLLTKYNQENSESDWISVKDRLPEPWQTVLVAQYSTKAVFTAKYSEHYGWNSTDDFLVDATHWMPLPKPPHENGEPK